MVLQLQLELAIGETVQKRLLPAMIVDVPAWV